MPLIIYTSMTTYWSGDPAAITSPISFASGKTSHQISTKKEAQATTSRAVCNGNVPKAPDVARDKLAESTGASETGISDGKPEGNTEGEPVGVPEGDSHGDAEGDREGDTDGDSDGDSLGDSEG
jgi:hypothetical protein